MNNLKFAAHAPLSKLSSCNSRFVLIMKPQPKGKVMGFTPILHTCKLKQNFTELSDDVKPRIPMNPVTLSPG